MQLESGSSTLFLHGLDTLPVLVPLLEAQRASTKIELHGCVVVASLWKYFYCFLFQRPFVVAIVQYSDYFSKLSWTKSEEYRYLRPSRILLPESAECSGRRNRNKN